MHNSHSTDYVAVRSALGLLGTLWRTVTTKLPELGYTVLP
jgi:hypothetical protein